jgi:hypothetical protein
MKNKPIILKYINHITKRTLLDELKYYGFYIWWNWLEERPRKLYWFLQRGWRGYADCDVWDFDYYLAKIITSGLKKLAKNSHNAIPTKEEFDKIIEGFDCAMLLVEEPGLDHNEKILAEQIKNEGFDLFKKYFNYFWD